MSPRSAALARALELAEAEASRTGSVIAQIEVDALKRELQAELGRVPEVHRVRHGRKPHWA